MSFGISIKTDKDVSINPEEINVLKYKEMLMSTVKDAIEILRYGNAEKIESVIFGITQKPKKENNSEKSNSSKESKKIHL